MMDRFTFYSVIVALSMLVNAILEQWGVVTMGAALLFVIHEVAEIRRGSK